MNNQYSSYKTVKQKWVMEIPSHWGWKRLKAVLSIRKERNDPIKTDNILSLTAKQGVIPYAEKDGVGGNKAKADLSQYNIAHENDLLVNCMNVVAGSAGVSRYYGAISPVYYAFHPMFDANIWYYHYIFRLFTFQRSLIGLGKGILMHETSTGKLNTVRMRISMDYLGNVLLPIPPHEEQDKIVSFLNWKVAAIGKLIRIKKHQISLLKSSLQAEIETQMHQYPNLNTVRLKQLGVFFKGGGFSRENLSNEKSYPALLYGDIYTQYTYRTSFVNHYVDKQSYQAARKIRKGDIVMAGTGETKDEIGKPILYDGNVPVSVGGDVIVFRPNSGVYPDYILYQLYGHDALRHRYLNGKGDIIVHIYPASLGNTVITLPSREDQERAVNHIRSMIDVIQGIINIHEQAIHNLHEYRDVLISDVVTGKIDVRGIEIPEYEYVADSAESDENDVEAEGTLNEE